MLFSHLPACCDSVVVVVCAAQYFAISSLVNGLLDIWMPLLSADVVISNERALEHIGDQTSPHHYESLTETNLLESMRCVAACCVCMLVI